MPWGAHLSKILKISRVLFTNRFPNCSRSWPRPKEHAIVETSETTSNESKTCLHYCSTPWSSAEMILTWFYKISIIHSWIWWLTVCWLFLTFIKIRKCDTSSDAFQSILLFVESWWRRGGCGIVDLQDLSSAQFWLWHVLWKNSSSSNMDCSSVLSPIFIPEQSKSIPLSCNTPDGVVGFC